MTKLVGMWQAAAVVSKKSQKWKIGKSNQEPYKSFNESKAENVDDIKYTSMPWVCNF